MYKTAFVSLTFVGHMLGRVEHQPVTCFYVRGVPAGHMLLRVWRWSLCALRLWVGVSGLVNRCWRHRDYVGRTVTSSYTRQCHHLASYACYKAVFMLHTASLHCFTWGRGCGQHSAAFPFAPQKAIVSEFRNLWTHCLDINSPYVGQLHCSASYWYTGGEPFCLLPWPWQTLIGWLIAFFWALYSRR